MSQIISLSIDLNKINKSKAKQHTNGALYYPITILVNDEKDKFGNDAAAIDQQTKEERDRKDKRNYLGNGKVVFSKPASSTPNNDLPW